MLTKYWKERLSTRNFVTQTRHGTKTTAMKKETDVANVTALVNTVNACSWWGGANIQKQNIMTYVCFAVMSVSFEVVLWKITSKTILIIQQYPVLSVEGTWAGVYLYENVKRTRAKHIKGSKERYLLLY